MAAGWVREIDPITGRPQLRFDGMSVELYPVRAVESLLEEAPEALAPSRFCLREWEEYIVVGAQDVAIVGGKRDKLGEKIFRFRFENQVGRARLRFTLPGDQMEGLLVEVLSTKYPTPAEHLNSFRTLLDDLSRYAAQLPFSISGPTEATVDESAAAPTPLFVYNFLLQNDKENDEPLRTALNIILAAPHRRLMDESRWVPIAEASVVDAEMLSQLLRHPEHLVKVPGNPGIACAPALNHHMPTHVWQVLPRDTYDTPENRFVRAFLGELLSAAQEVREQGWWRQVPAKNQTRIDDLIGYMTEILRTSMFEEVGEMVVVPASSQVLLRRDGYRELLALWRLFQLARHPFFANLQTAIDLRDVATLYEFWCFYRLEAEFTKVLGASPTAKLTVTDEGGLEYKDKASFFEWANGGCLIFNQSFSGRTAAFYSYSVALRPDFTFMPGPGFTDGDHRVIFFDAKFRFESTTWNIDDDNDRERLVKRADLYKMHTYRDALHARSAIALFPGNEPGFYRVGKGKVQPQPTFAEMLKLEGVGAFSMEPGKE